MAKGKNKKNRSKVIFEEEIIKKETADKILNALPSKKKKIEKVTGQQEQGKHNNHLVNDVSESNTVTLNKTKKRGQKKPMQGLNKDLNEPAKKKKRKKSELQDNEIKSLNDETQEPRRKKKKRSKINAESEDNNIDNSSTEIPKNKNQDVKEENQEDAEEEEEAESSTTLEKPKQAESKRSLKRKKHVKLLEDKKLKSELKMQQNCLNYLSKWKHSRNDWKFEKLKQVWLHQNLLDCSKVPEEFWETTLEYFTGSKGFIRNAVLKAALKVIEDEEKAENEDADNDDVKLKRARDIVQSLQE